MVFGENFEYQVDATKQQEIEETLENTKKELSLLHQDKGAAEQFSLEQITNIVKFCDKFGDNVDFFTVRARADKFGFSSQGAEVKKAQAKSLAESLTKKNFSVSPDLSTGNSAQARIRALTVLEQLPLDVLNKIKDKIKFDVKPTEEGDEKGTYRFASLDINIHGEKIPDIQNGGQPSLLDIPVDQNTKKDIEDKGPEEDQPEENIPLSPDEFKKFESWEGLQRPLGTHMFLRIKLPTKDGKEERKNFIKRTFYKIENGKLIVLNANRKITDKPFNYYKANKANSIVMDMSETLGVSCKNDLEKISKVTRSAMVGTQSLAYLNSFTKNDPKFALNQLYSNYGQKEEWKSYLTRGKEIEVKSRQQLLADNNQ